MVDAEAAASAARIALRDLHGPGHGAARAAVANGDVDSAFLVARLDRPERSFYLAPWRDERGVVLVAQIDAASGALNSVVVLAEPVGDVLIPPERARSLVIAGRGGAAGDPQLVWRPCRESMSPLQPLYRVPTEGGAAYVAMDGTIHDRLTPLGKGGQEKG